MRDGDSSAVRKEPAIAYKRQQLEKKCLVHSDLAGSPAASLRLPTRLVVTLGLRIVMHDALSICRFHAYHFERGAELTLGKGK